MASGKEPYRHHKGIHGHPNLCGVCFPLQRFIPGFGGGYETDDWQRLHAYTFYLTNIDIVSFGAVPEEAEAREKLVFALDALLEPLEEKRTEFPEDLQEKLLYLSSRSQDVPLMEEILAELEALPVT